MIQALYTYNDCADNITLAGQYASGGACAIIRLYIIMGSFVFSACSVT